MELKLYNQRNRITELYRIPKSWFFKLWKQNFSYLMKIQINYEVQICWITFCDKKTFFVYKTNISKVVKNGQMYKKAPTFYSHPLENLLNGNELGILSDFVPISLTGLTNIMNNSKRYSNDSFNISKSFFTV